jgi:hypothetical protein
MGWRDVHCPRNQGKLLFKIVDGQIEIGCKDCRIEERRKNRYVILVLHRYTFEGELVDTQVISLDPVSQRHVTVPGSAQHR